MALEGATKRVQTMREPWGELRCAVIGDGTLSGGHGVGSTHITVEQS